MGASSLNPGSGVARCRAAEFGRPNIVLRRRKLYGDRHLLSNHGLAQVFVANERDGTWGKAIPIPRLNDLNSGGDAADLLSCSSPGDCAAGGFYSTSRNQYAYVASEVGWRWGPAPTLPGTGDDAALKAIDCSANGYCGAGGTRDSGGRRAGLRRHRNPSCVEEGHHDSRAPYWAINIRLWFRCRCDLVPGAHQLQRWRGLLI